MTDQKNTDGDDQQVLPGPQNGTLQFLDQKERRK